MIALATAALALTALVTPSRGDAFTIAVNGAASHSIPSTLYGIMWEDINHSGDGGFYAELIRNRAFQQKDVSNQADALEAYTAVGRAQLAVVTNTPAVSSSLPNSLALTVPAGSSGSVGFGNQGFWGINVNASWTYTASVYAKLPQGSNFRGQVTLGLQSATTGRVYASGTFSGLSTSWRQFTVSLRPSANGADTYNNFTVLVDGAAASGQTIYFTLISLFPPTYRNRPNGIRVDVAERIAALRPGFFRFGGNNLEGESAAQRWTWSNTVGSLLNRPGRRGNWNYINTDGLGLMELIYLTEDLNMQLIASVWAGVSLNPTTSVSNSSLQPYIDEAVGLLNFLTGDPSRSSAAALRASLGHPDPVTVRYCEIGNEDFFASDTYASYRWARFYSVLSQTFPDITFVATSTVNSPRLTPRPPAWDVHVYEIPSWFPANAFYYDGFARDGTVYLELEYAVTSTSSSCLYGSVSCGRLPWSTLEAAVSEAAFATGFERNADIVVAAAYAPVMQNFQSPDAWQWIPDLLGYNASHTLPSASYWAQQLLSLNKGTEYLPSTLPTRGGAVQWSVTRDANTRTVLIKIANTASSSSTFTINLPFSVASRGTASVLGSTAGASGANTIDHPNQVAITTSTVATGPSFQYTTAGLTFTVIAIAQS